jgi:ureidoglycolate dehydrogenase (NAD+)
MEAVAADDLRAFVVDVLRASRMEADCAESVASALVWADARGVYSHGVTRLPRYVEWINSGQINPTPSLSERSCSASCVILDADRAAGPHAMIRAADRSLELAAVHGLGAVIVRATTHTAALGYYSQRAARAKTVCIAAAASTPLMAYHGSRAKGASTSPLTIAAYREGAEPLLFDMSAGVISNGKLLAAAAAKMPIEPGWALDAQGNPTTDAEAAVTLLPLGGPKGSGLSLMIEIVASLLASNPILSRALSNTPEGKRHRQNAVVISLDIARFCDPSWFSQEISRLSDALKALPRSDPAEEIRLPGERGDATERESRATGIPLPASLRPPLQALASQFGLSPAWLS